MLKNFNFLRFLSPQIQKKPNFLFCIEKVNGLTLKEFQTLTGSFLDDLSETVENQQNTNIEDVELTDGVLKIYSKSLKTFVINRQSPNRQIWYSSPISGPQRFSYNNESKKWTNSLNQPIDDLLLEEIKIIK